MTLWDLDVNAQAFITEVKPLPENERLASLGFAQKQKVICLQKMALSGPKVYQIGDNVFSLSKELALSISVSTEKI